MDYRIAISEENDNEEIHNWFGDIVSSPAVVAEPQNVQDIVSILTDTAKYPSPVRAIGSNHSNTQCAVANNGTVLFMDKMNRILNIGNDTVTAEAGALYIDVSHALEKHNLQFYINVEIGNLTVGSAACCGTKSASLQGEYGQVGSYVIAMKLVTPAGEILEITEEGQPELFQAARSSYGLFGVVVEATFRIKPLESMEVSHSLYNLDTFIEQLPALKARGESMMMYIGPFTNTITVEFRRYRPDENPQNATHWQWKVRNFFWAVFAPCYSYFITKYVQCRCLRYGLIDLFNFLINYVLILLLNGTNTLSPDQIIRYAENANHRRYTYSFWAFPEDDYPNVLRDFFKFCNDYYQKTGYRTNMMNLGYRVTQDPSSLLSYSFDGNAMSIDPAISSGAGIEGWDKFLDAFNEFSSQRNGVPILNQTKSITRSQVEKAFGERLVTFEAYRKRFDPTGRLFNQFFIDLLK